MNHKYFLSGLVIVRDEEDYIEEWLRYHIEEMGFEHFYIYDDESKIPVYDYLEKVNFKYLDKITVFPWSVSACSQTDSHNDFLKRYGCETKWVLAFDPDEYVVIKEGQTKTLVQFLQEYDDADIIGIKWTHFNANGHVHKTEGTDMERFTTPFALPNQENEGKCFAKPSSVIFYNAHHPHMTTDGNPNLEKEIICTDRICTSFFQLNHYFTRSYDEYVRKINRGSVLNWYRRRMSEFFTINPDLKYLDDGIEYVQPYGHNNGEGAIQEK